MKTAILLLASGMGRRFGSNKLLEPLGNDLIIDYSLNAATGSIADNVTIVCSREVCRYISSKGPFSLIQNDEPDIGMSHSIHLGVEYLRGDYDSILVINADQPLIQADLINEIIRLGKENPGHIVCVEADGKLRGPALFGSEYFDDLMNVSGDSGGREILGQAEGVLSIRVDELEVRDIDTAEDKAFVEDYMRAAGLLR